MFAKIAFISVLYWLNAMAAKHSEFPQWDQTPWVVSNANETITITCVHDQYYPFNALTSAARNVVWILPRETSYLHLKPGESVLGWTAKNDTSKSLLIEKSKFNVPGKTDGMYVCAVLAEVPKSNVTNLYSWYYLRWGVGLYTNVPAMNPGSIAHRYSKQFTIAGAALAVYTVLAVAFGLTLFFRYGTKAHKEEEYGDEEAGGEIVISSKDDKEDVVYF